MLPVLGGISGSTKVTLTIACFYLNELNENKKKRRASLEGLVVSFVRPRGPQKFVCASGRFVI
jgi:hypothetical protein